MSPRCNFLEAVNNIYDVLRWAETREDSKHVLIAHLLELQHLFKDSEDGKEHLDALFDRIFRATSGRQI